jgi:plasmid stability protein
MPKMIQIRNVPEALHRRLKSRAALEGKSLSDYLLAELRRVAERPTLAEMIERLQKLSATNPQPPPEQVIRAERDSR